MAAIRIPVAKCPDKKCTWVATVIKDAPETRRAAELRRDKHVIRKHNMRLPWS